MLVSFTKMHGLGNDFVVIDAISQIIKLQPAHIKKIASRNFGIGCDQVLLIEPPRRAEADLFYRIYNSDGTEAEQCGNGARCIAQFVINHGLINKNKIIADCLAGEVIMHINNDNLVTIDFGKIATEVHKQPLAIPGLANEIFTINLGNPHGICIVEDLTKLAIAKLGKQISNLAIFPTQANITFMQILTANNVYLYTFERGAGLTLACGSGACAAVIVGNQLGLLDNSVTAQFACGELTITFTKETNNLTMQGPANSVYIGKFKI